MRKIFSMLTIALLATACGGIRPPQPPQPPPATQAMAVVVRDLVHPSKAVEGANVVCSIDGSPSVELVTNADGYTSFTGFSYRVYTCVTTKENYENNTANHYLTPDDNTLTVPLTPVQAPTPTHPGPIVGRLRIEGNCFRDDTGCVLPIYAHAGDAFSRFVRDPGFVNSQLDGIASQGYHGIRVWAVLGGRYWAGREVGPGVTPDYWGQLEKFLTELKNRNLRAVWSMGDIGQLQGTRQDYMQQLAAVNSRYEVIDWLDCGNEAWQTGEPDPTRLAQCVGYYRSAGGTALLTLTSPPSEETEDLNDYSIPPADAYDVHGYRGGHHWDKIRHIFSIAYEGRPNKRQGIQSEPFGNGGLVSVTENRDELNHEAMGLGAVMSHISRQVWVWFSGEGVILQRGLETQQGYANSAAITARLPKDLTTYTLLHHSGGTWANTRVLIPPQDNVRIDGVDTPDGRTVQVIYGPAGSYNITAARGFTGKVCNPADATCEDIAWSPGQVVNFTFERGRVIVGQIH